MMTTHLLLLTIVVASSLLLSSSTPVKHLAGPPHEFVNHRVPDPSLFLTEERSASEMIWFDSNTPGLLYTAHVPVDGPTAFVFTFASPHANQVQLELVDPNGKAIDISSLRQDGTYPIGDNLEIPSQTYIVPNSLRGFYTLNLRSKTLSLDELELLADSAYPNAILTFINNDYVEIESHLNTYVIKKGKDIGIVSTILDLSPDAAASNIVIKSALMEVISPDGVDHEIPMSDSSPVLATFGIPPESGYYAAVFPAQFSGDHILQAKLEGLYSEDGVTNIPFLRSTEHIIEVSDASLELTGQSRVRTIDSGHVAIDIQTTGTGSDLRAYTEVWGIEVLSQQPKPVCWVGGIVSLIDGYVTLELDTKWLQLAGVQGPLMLYNTYISDLKTSFPVTHSQSEIKVSLSENIRVQPSLQLEITKEMRVGRNPLKVARNVSADVPNLVLLPGYCSTSNPFTSSKQFTQAAPFSTGGGNLGNHEFSTRVLAYVDSLGITSYSTIGHSQGGMVGAHLYNYYFTGMDNAAGGRLIQTIGTPFQGCTAAGSLANLGKIFGIACGSNNDLSLDGAVNWLGGITTETRKEVFYYTTTYKLGNFFGDYCSLPMNLILQWPNDGTTELTYSGLTGGTNLGNKEQWCHTTGMAYATQTSDEARNKEMNDNAAR